MIQITPQTRIVVAVDAGDFQVAIIKVIGIVADGNSVGIAFH